MDKMHNIRLANLLHIELLNDKLNDMFNDLYDQVSDEVDSDVMVSLDNRLYIDARNASIKPTIETILKRKYDN